MLATRTSSVSGGRVSEVHAFERGRRWLKMERETGFEPATSTLARSHSTTELFPLPGADGHHEDARPLSEAANRTTAPADRSRQPTPRQRSLECARDIP